MTVVEAGSPLLEKCPDLFLIPLLSIYNLNTRACTSVVGFYGCLKYLVLNFIPGGIPEEDILYVIRNLVHSRFAQR